MASDENSPLKPVPSGSPAGSPSGVITMKSGDETSRWTLQRLDDEVVAGMSDSSPSSVRVDACKIRIRVREGNREDSQSFLRPPSCRRPETNRSPRRYARARESPRTMCRARSSNPGIVERVCRDDECQRNFLIGVCGRVRRVIFLPLRQSTSSYPVHRDGRGAAGSTRTPRRTCAGRASTPHGASRIPDPRKLFHRLPDRG